MSVTPFGRQKVPIESGTSSFIRRYYAGSSCSDPSHGVSRDCGSSPQPSVFSCEVDVCRTAMDLLAILDGPSMAKLREAVGTGVDKMKFLALLREAIMSSVGAQVPVSLRQSEQDFQSKLRVAASFDENSLAAVVRSVNKYCSQVVTFSDFMDFLMSAGTCDTNAYVAGLKTKTEKIVRPCTSVTQVSDTAFHRVVSLSSHNCFAAAGLRSVTFIDSFGLPVPDCGRIEMPVHASATITCMIFAAEIDELVVGFSNSEICCFRFTDGHMARQTKVCGTPCSLAWFATTSRGNGVVVCGMKEGLLVGLSTPMKSVIRSSWVSRLSSNDSVPCLARLPSEDLVACACKNSLFLCDAVTGALKHKPRIFAERISCMLYHAPSAALIWGLCRTPNTLYLLSKELLTTTSVEPAQIQRSQFAIGEPLQHLFCDPSRPQCVLSVDTSNYIQRWNLAALLPVENEDGPLRVPGGFVASVSACTNSTAALCVTRAGVFKISEAHAAVAINAEECEDPSDPSTLVEMLACLPEHAELTAASHYSKCFVRICVSSIALVDSTTQQALWSVPLKWPQRISSACALPGGLVCLLGTSCGSLLTLSLDPSSLGEISRVCSDLDCEILNVAFDEITRIAVVRRFDGLVATMQLSRGRPSVLFGPKIVTSVANCVAFCYEERLRQCFMLDSADWRVKRGVLTQTGEMLWIEGGYSLDETEASNYGAFLLGASENAAGDETAVALLAYGETRSVGVTILHFSAHGSSVRAHRCCVEAGCPTAVCFAETGSFFGTAEGEVFSIQVNSVPPEVNLLHVLPCAVDAIASMPWQYNIVASTVEGRTYMLFEESPAESPSSTENARAAESKERCRTSFLTDLPNEVLVQRRRVQSAAVTGRSNMAPHSTATSASRVPSATGATSLRRGKSEPQIQLAAAAQRRAIVHTPAPRVRSRWR